MEQLQFDDRSVASGIGRSSRDFDGDGKSDILWQNMSGQAAVWLMNGAAVVSGPLVGGNPGAAWHIVAQAD